MPPQTTFESRKDVRILLRYALCWGLQIDNPHFSEKLAEHGIKSAREQGTSHVNYQTIRSASIWYLGQDYTRLLPAKTIKKGESTVPFEVRMRILKHDINVLRGAVLILWGTLDFWTCVPTSTSSGTDRQFRHLTDELWSWNVLDNHLLDEEERVGDDQGISVDGQIEGSQRELNWWKAMKVKPQPEEVNSQPAEDKRNKCEYASEGSDRVEPRRNHHHQKQEEIENSSSNISSRQTTSPVGDWVHVPHQPLSLRKPGLDGLLPKITPMKTSSEHKRPERSRKHHTRESVKWREASMKGFSLGKDVAVDAPTPRITGESSKMIKKLLPVCRSDLRRTILSEDPRRSTPLEDSLGNTAMHYHASQLFFRDRLDMFMFTKVNPLEEESQNMSKLNNANQSWLFTVNPEHLEHSTSRLCRLIDNCGSGTPWLFHGKHEACSACTSCYCVKNAPPLAFQDRHGQTWLHQYLYHNKWKPEQWMHMTETGKCRAVELLELCKYYGMDPAVKDNMGRTVLDFLTPHIQSEALDSDTDNTLFAILDQETGLTEYALASWGVDSTSRVQSWAGWLREAASCSNDPLHGINFAFAQPVHGAGTAAQDIYDDQGDTLLSAFIAFVDPEIMEAKHVQETLRHILARNPRVDLRDRNGLTPLHLANKLALPHVVATLLHHMSTHHGSAGFTGAPDDMALQKALAVASYDGTALITDLRATYWKACDSNDDQAVFIEADALVCVSLITNAVNGKIFDDFEFRPLRQRYMETKKRTCEAQSC